MGPHGPIIGGAVRVRGFLLKPNGVKICIISLIKTFKNHLLCLITYQDTRKKIAFFSRNCVIMKNLKLIFLGIMERASENAIEIIFLKFF